MKIERNLSDLSQPFDLIVVGGGITGVSVAREAAVRGIRTLCVEKDDFACATSAATSKLLHGGLRYLENFEFSLVRESLAERRILGLAAGHLSRPMPFLVPIYEWSNPGRFMLQAGLTTYDLLAYDRNLGAPEDKLSPGSKWLSREEFLKREPRIDANQLKGGFIYYDYQSLHPERLALAFVKTAEQAGARMLNHCKVTGFSFKPGTRQLDTVQFTDSITGKKHSAKGTVIVNASGPWMDIVLGLVEKDSIHKVQRSKGIHLITERLIGDNTLFVRNKQGHHCLMIPWEGMTLIGPTDTPYEGHPDNLRPTEEDVQGLIDLVNEFLPGSPLTREKVKHVPIGIRPLVFSGKSTYRASRKYEIYDHGAESGLEGLVSVVGGKWTTSRKLGEDVIHHVLPVLNKLDPTASARIKDVRTDEDPLVGFPAFAASATELWEQIALVNHRVPDNVLNHLFTMYGTEYTDVLDLAKKDASLLKRVSDEPGKFDIMAQVVFAIQNESAKSLSDVLLRRLAIGAAGYPGDATTRKVADLCAKLLKWNPLKKSAEIKSFKDSFPLELLGPKKSKGKK
ncbi:MAG: glycerol-3-phosphate dehydrogenase/oxidase [Spirochaetia bacterium]|nr:glycerol-3-phosphate dehydrogenase/oxidase [Spirochaetia bacterium]